MKIMGNSLRKILFSGLIFIASLSVMIVFLAVLIPVKTSKPYSTVIYSSDSTALYVFLSNDDKWRLPVQLREVSPELIQALIFKEDKYFRYHPGVNPAAVARAVLSNLIHWKKVSGASTLTMQTARLLYPARRTIGNKLVEIFRALQLEARLSKNEILELYLSLAPYGSNIEGVQAASMQFFGKPASKLSLGEATMLALIPNRPNSLSPFSASAQLLKARNIWLLRMRNTGLFNEEQTEDALAELLPEKRHSMPRYIPHLAFRLKQRYPWQDRIYTHINTAIQQKAELLLSDYLEQMHSWKIYNGSVMIIDNLNHSVVAYCGSSDYHDWVHAGQVDGLQSVRSPGSTLKPVVYALAIDKGLITPKSMLMDVPVDFSGYVPSNYDGKFLGRVSVENALSLSLNIPAVELLEKTGINELTGVLEKAGFRSLTAKKSSLGLSMILGGCSVKPEEVAGLFSAFANVGKFFKPALVKDDNPEPVTLFSAESAYLVAEMLSKTQRPDFPENFQNVVNAPVISWKTGTSYGRRDAWATGFNSRFTVTVWIGNFSGEGVPELTGAKVATPLLFQIFKRIDNLAGEVWLLPPGKIDYRMVCSVSGMPANDYCDQQVMDEFIPGVSPYQKCMHLLKIYTSLNEGIAYCLHCLPATGYKTVIYPNLASELAAWYRSEHIPFKEIPPHNPACQHVLSGAAPRITSPSDGKEFLIEKDGLLSLQCIADPGVTEVYWYINNRFYRKASVKETLFFIPEKGINKISCSDDKGRNSDSRIKVEHY